MLPAGRQGACDSCNSCRRLPCRAGPRPSMPRLRQRRRPRSAPWMQRLRLAKRAPAAFWLASDRMPLLGPKRASRARRPPRPSPRPAAAHGAGAIPRRCPVALHPRPHRHQRPMETLIGDTSSIELQYVYGLKTGFQMALGGPFTAPARCAGRGKSVLGHRTGSRLPRLHGHGPGCLGATPVRHARRLQLATGAEFIPIAK